MNTCSCFDNGLDLMTCRLNKLKRGCDSGEPPPRNWFIWHRATAFFFFFHFFPFSFHLSCEQMPRVFFFIQNKFRKFGNRYSECIYMSDNIQKCHIYIYIVVDVTGTKRLHCIPWACSRRRQDLQLKIFPNLRPLDVICRSDRVSTL